MSMKKREKEKEFDKTIVSLSLVVEGENKLFLILIEWFHTNSNHSSMTSFINVPLCLFTVAV